MLDLQPSFLGRYHFLPFFVSLRPLSPVHAVNPATDTFHPRPLDSQFHSVVPSATPYKTANPRQNILSPASPETLVRPTGRRYNTTSSTVSDNTAKLSSPILLQRTVSYDAGTNPPRRGSVYKMAEQQNTARRRRSSSLLQVYHEPPEPVEQLSDRAALPNGNANWVNAKGEKEMGTARSWEK